MSRKKSDFPEITYKFVEKSNYTGGYGSKKTKFPVFLVVIIIILALIYIGSFILSKKYGDNFLTYFLIDFKKEEKRPEDIPDTSKKETDNTETASDDTSEFDNTEEMEEEKNVETEPEKPKADAKTRIELQTAIFLEVNPDKINTLISEYEEKTGETFRDSYLFQSDEEKIPDELIQSLSREEASLLRNEIYARRGYQFKGRLDRFFLQKSWYNPAQARVALTGIELDNMNSIYSYEMKKGWK